MHLLVIASFITGAQHHPMHQNCTKSIPTVSLKIIITAHALFVYICGDESASWAYIMYVTRSVNTTPIRERLPSVSHESTKTCTPRIVRLPDLHAARSSHICAPVCVCTFSIFTEIFRKSRYRQLTLSTPRGQTDRDTARPTHCVSVNICILFFNLVSSEKWNSHWVVHRRFWAPISSYTIHENCPLISSVIKLEKHFRRYIRVFFSLAHSPARYVW